MFGSDINPADMIGLGVGGCLVLIIAAGAYVWNEWRKLPPEPPTPFDRGDNRNAEPPP